VLLHRAWDRTLAGEAQAKPWPWADTWPVARLKLPAVDADLIVLAGASGQALAFGPGHVSGTAAPGRPGLSIIGGHRDTHLKVLAELAPGSRIEIQRPDGETRVYRVETTSIADARHPWAAPVEADGLVLVTCYPFDALIPGGPLRYLVHAAPVE
jgi:sortase A